MSQQTNGSPHCVALAQAVRTRADTLGDAAYMAQEEISGDLYRLARDAAELGRVLANIVEGKPLARAFGAPGDWGYSHPIGKALAAYYASAGAAGVLGTATPQDQAIYDSMAERYQRERTCGVLVDAPGEEDHRMAFCPACFVEVTPEQAGQQINAARVLAEFAKTAPGRLPQRIQDAIEVVTAAGVVGTDHQTFSPSPTDGGRE